MVGGMLLLRKAQIENMDILRRAVTDRRFIYDQIFSRHEAVLCSHLEMLSMVKDQIAPEVNGFQTVSSMVNKTVLAMNQLKIARKHMVSSLLKFLFIGLIIDCYLFR